MDLRSWILFTGLLRAMRLHDMTASQLHRWRKRLGWSQVETASRLGIAQSKVSAFETGARKIPLYIVKLVECLSKTM